MYIIVKQLLDYIMAALGLIVGLPLMLFAAAAIRLDSQGPIFFRQNRSGLNGRIFSVVKFRTMRTDRHSSDGVELSDVDRMTKVGRVLRKTSLDELPQLFNILKGEMSFVGPRPLLVKYLPLYSLEEMQRHSVKPGITGWAQVHGRNALPWSERFKLDVWYTENLSLTTDLLIVFMTIGRVIRGDGVDKTDKLTMDEFRGSISQ